MRLSLVDAGTFDWNALSIGVAWRVVALSAVDIHWSVAVGTQSGLLVVVVLKCVVL